MDLHKHKNIFHQYIEQVSSNLRIDPALIEKDYFVFFLLSELNKEIPGLLFKGGTCLSSAFHIIDRFSEDIDLSLDNEHFGRGKNINANHKVVEVCERLGLIIKNKEEAVKRSHASFNRYYIEYPSFYESDAIKRNIQLEMAFFQKAYPSEPKEVNSLIGFFLNNNGGEKVIEQYNLESFIICVQSLERTFVDKVFAICDYFERNESTRNSRHIYDVYKIYNKLNMGDHELKDLIESVKNDRKKNAKAVSAQDGYKVNETLREIVDSKFYKNDFETITKAMLIRKIEYDEVITVLDKIIETNLFKD